jgi:hypothetical protein
MSINKYPSSSPVLSVPNMVGFPKPTSKKHELMMYGVWTSKGRFSRAE